VLSYATISPGDSMTDAELSERARVWGRELEESRRFSRSSVLVAELGEGSDLRGVIVEAEAGAPPLFDGGAAYASMALPFVDGRRATLTLKAGPNLGAASYRDEAAADLPLVLDAGLVYANDLIETGKISGNRLSASIGFGPRLGPLSDLLLRARAGTRFAALEAALELGGFSLLGIEGLDGTLIALGDSYPSPPAERLEALADLRFGLGRATASLAAAAGRSSAAVDSSERFDLRSGDAYLRGPELGPGSVAAFALGRADVDCSVMNIRLASWLPLSFGPFAFCEAVLVPPEAGAVRLLAGAAGFGLRLKLGPPVGVTADVGYALSDRGRGALVITVFSLNPLSGEELR
jgi:hypothetical protein